MELHETKHCLQKWHRMAFKIPHAHPVGVVFGWKDVIVDGEILHHIGGLGYLGALLPAFSLYLPFTVVFGQRGAV